MELKSLITSIEALAVEVRTTSRGKIHVGEYSGREEGCEFKKIGVVDTEEYCLGGEKDKVSVHQVCLKIFKDVLKRLPDGDAILYWRALPDYEEQEDFATGLIMFRVRLRLGWLVED